MAVTTLDYDYSKLKGKIIEVFGTQRDFAKAIGISQQTISYKLNGLAEWTQEDIEKTISALGIPASEIHIYFFYQKS